MEKTINCNLIIYIFHIMKVSGMGHYYEILVRTLDEETYKLIFSQVVMIHYTEEDGVLKRWSYLQHEEKKKSSILQIENSMRIKQFEKQSKGTCSTEDLKEYFLHDEEGGIIEILAYDNLQYVKI